MTVDELEALIAKVEQTLNCNLFWGRNSQGSWFAYPQRSDGRCDHVDGATLPEVITKLREWATPPKPETLTITVPFSWVEAMSTHTKHGPITTGARVAEICREAIKPWAQS